MGIIARIRHLLAPKAPAYQPHSVDRSNFASAAEKLEKLRGDITPTMGEPAPRPQDGKIERTAASARATRNAEMSTGGTVVERITDRSSTRRSSS